MAAALKGGGFRSAASYLSELKLKHIEENFVIEPALGRALKLATDSTERGIGPASKAVEAQLSRGHRSAGDLIPWTLSQQFGDSNFAQLSGARIVRVAVHPSVQGMGYGSRAMELLFRFYNGEMVSLQPGNNSFDMMQGLIMPKKSK